MPLVPQKEKFIYTVGFADIFGVIYFDVIYVRFEWGKKMQCMDNKKSSCTKEIFFDATVGVSPLFIAIYYCWYLLRFCIYL